MSMKKKVLATTLAASMAFTTFSAVPFSSNSFLGNVTAITANAELPDQASGLLDKLDQWYNEMSSAEISTLLEISGRISEIAEAAPTEAYTAITKPLWNKIDAERTDPAAYPNLTEENVLGTFLQLSAAITQDTRSNRDDALSEFLLGESEVPTRAVMDQLLELYDIDGEDADEFWDLEGFLTDLEDNVVSVIEDVDPSDWVDDENEFSAVIFANMKQAITDTVQQSDSSFGQLLEAIGITTTDLRVMKDDLEVALTPAPGEEAVDGDGEATMIFAKAFLRSYLAQDDDRDSSPYIPPRPSDSDDADGGDEETELVFIPDDIDGEIDELVDQLLDLVQKVEDAETQTERSEAIQNAIEFVEQNFREFGILNASAVVQVDQGTATAEPPVDEVKAKMDEVMDTLGVLNDILTEHGLLEALVEVSIDLGEVDADEVRVTLDEEVLEAARQYGIEWITVKVNGVELLISPQEFTSDIELVIRHNEDADVEDDAWVTPAYEVQVLVDGEPQTLFDHQVKMRIPVANMDGVDTELLTLVKIEGDKLLFYGGKYDAEHGKLVALRSGLSTYAVMENNVTFDDLGAIAAWAGRSIEVAAAKGIISGRAEGQFDPRANVTRAEFATMLVKLFGLEREDRTTNAFADVAADDWYMPYIAAAVEEELIFGRGNGMFEPNAEVTRVEMAVMAARALQKYNRLTEVEQPEEFLQRFADTAGIHAGMQADTALAIREDIMKGQAKGVFHPDGNSTRAEAAVVIYNLLNLFDLK